MKVINVIQLRQATIENVASFCFTPEHEKDMVVEAEKHYLECVRNNRSEHDELGENPTDEDILGMDHFSNKCGYEVTLVWSHNIVVSVNLLNNGDN